MIWSSFALSLYFSSKICRAGKCDLVDVFLHLIRSHAETVIDKLAMVFVIRIYDNLDLVLYSLPDSSYSPISSSFFNFVMASQPLEISSL